MIEIAVSDVDSGVTSAIAQALQGAQRRLRVVAVAADNPSRRARLVADLAVGLEGVFESDAELLRHLPVDVYYVPAATARAGQVALDAIEAGTHVAACRRLFDDAAWTTAVARRASECLVKVAAVTDLDGDSPNDDAGRQALTDDLIAFADYLEEGLGEYPGKDLMTGSEMP